MSTTSPTIVSRQVIVPTKLTLSPANIANISSDEMLTALIALQEKEDTIYSSKLLSMWDQGLYRNQLLTRDAATQYCTKRSLANIDKLRTARNTWLDRQAKVIAHKIIAAAELKEDIKNVKDDWYIQYPKMKCCLRQFQIDSTKPCYQQLFTDFPNKSKAKLLHGGTGTGKTYVANYQILRAMKENWFLTVAKATVPWPVFIVTKASVVEQFWRVAKYQFRIPMDQVVVTNYEQLRSSFGETYIERQTEVVNGQEVKRFVWIEFMNPVLVIWDECHALKNIGSSQSKIAQGFNNIEHTETRQIFMSATPATRVNDLKCFGVATKRPLMETLQKV